MSNSDQTIEININGTEYEVPKKDDISYDEIVQLAYPELLGDPNAMFTITYRKGGNENKPAGQLNKGESVKAKKGMVFDVVPTTKS